MDIKALAIRIVAFAGLIAVLPGIGSMTGGKAEAGGGPVENLPGCTTGALSHGDDSNFSDAIPLPFTANFFGETYDHVYVNNNGNVTFDGGLSTFTPEGLLNTSRVIIAPFWADVDTSPEASGVTTYGSTTVDGHDAFCVNWVNVGYYSSHIDKLNSFQLLLIDQSDIGAGDFDIVMNYDQVQWETGDLSGGAGGLGGNSARMGYSNGVDVSFEYPGSGVNGAFLDSSASGLAHNSRSSLTNGRYVFQVRSGAPPAGGQVSGVITRADTHGALAGAIVAMCTDVCSTTTANSEGFYTFTALPEGQYILYVYPPTADLVLRPSQSDPFHLADTDVIQDKNVELQIADLPPDGTEMPTRNPNAAIPWIGWHTTTPMSEVSPSGLATIFVEVLQNGSVIATFSLTEGGPGPTAGTSVYTGTVPDLFPHHGWVRFRKHVGNNIEEFDAWVDPSGKVKTVGGDPIEGATVTIYRSDSPAGPFTVVPDGSTIMSPTNRANPDMTDANGDFGWDVIAGYYKVRAEKAGCTDPNNPAQSFVETDVLTIPPPVTDLDLRLDCGGSIWGDIDCSNAADIGDAINVQRAIAGLSVNYGNDCPHVGDVVMVNGVQRTWGDIDCSGAADIGDAINIQRAIAGLSVNYGSGCPEIGDTVTVT